MNIENSSSSRALERKPIVDITEILDFEKYFPLSNKRLSDRRRIILNMVSGYVSMNEQAGLMRFTLAMPGDFDYLPYCEYGAMFTAKLSKYLKTKNLEPVFIWKMEDLSRPLPIYEFALLHAAKVHAARYEVMRVVKDLWTRLLGGNENGRVIFTHWASLEWRDVDFSMAVEREIKSLYYLGRHWDSCIMQGE